MKINFNNQDLKKLDDLLSQRDENLEVSDLWNSFLEDKYDALNEEGIHELMEKEGLEQEEAVEEAFFSFLNLDASDPLIEKMKEDTGFGSLSVLDPEEFLTQPFNSLKIQKALYGPYQLSYNYFEPFELFNDENTYGEKDSYYAEKTHVGYFSRKVPYLVLTQKSQVWMSVTPHEVHTMRNDVSNAKGKVLTLGLGLGYFAYEVSNKEDVTSVTIVEKDAQVIQLFTRNILPLFPHREKIHIIKQDAFRYMERNYLDDGGYDYTFIDIYHTPEDALPMYLRFKAIEEKCQLSRIHYWIEESILCLLRRYLLTLVEEYFQGYEKEAYEEVVDDETLILSKLYSAMEDMTFNSFEELTEFLSDNSLSQFCRKVF